jgi:TorA maturation chaperone TorD
MTTAEVPEAAAIDLARECLYRFLATVLSDPYADGWRPLFNPVNQRLVCEAAELLRAEAAAEPVPPGFGELPAEQLDLAPLIEELRRPEAALRREYDRVFGLVFAGECPPYETEYHPPSEPFFRAQQMADVAGFYRAFGLDPGQATSERPDHIALELEFLAFLLLKKRLALAEGSPDAVEQAAVCDEAGRKFFREHLAWWLPSFAAGLRRKAGGGLYQEVGRALAALLPLERGCYQVPPPRIPLQAARVEKPEEEPQCAGCAGPG